MPYPVTVRRRLVALSALGLLQGAWGQLPGGMGLETFYDADQVNLRADKVKVIHIAEFPGLPKHLYVLDQRGKIWGVFPSAAGYAGLEWFNYGGASYSKHLLADFSDETAYSAEGEAGAYSIAFHPEFEENRKFYVYYYKKNPQRGGSLRKDPFGNQAGDLVLDEWETASDDVKVVTRVREEVFKYEHQPAIGGGTAKFGPDGLMYLTVSDYDGSARDRTSLARKVHRIDLTTPPPAGASYAIPRDNPYFNSPDPGVRKETWAIGFRNPWSMAFDWDTGALWLGDVDQTAWEEINLVEKGGDYGWDKGGDLGVNGDHGNSFSGPCAQGEPSGNRPGDCSPYTDPAYAFPRSGDMGLTCIIVGQVFRGSKASPFYGALLGAGNTTDKIWAYRKGDALARIVGSAEAQFHGQHHRGIGSMSSGIGGVIYVAALDWFDPANKRYTSSDPEYFEIFRLSHPDLTLKSYQEVTDIHSRKRRAFIPGAPRLGVRLGLPGIPPNPLPGFDLEGRRLSRTWEGAPGVYILETAAVR